MKRHARAVLIGLVVAAGLAALSPSRSIAQGVAERARVSYLFAYFVGNGEDGLHLASSDDGLTWNALRGGASFLTPTVGSKLMRDPCVVLGPDGVFHMVWTTGWWDRGSASPIRRI
jgi:hypothetical protein